MTLEMKLRRTSELMHLWGDAERLCNALCHKLEWACDGDTIRRLEAIRSRARKRAARRYAHYTNWYKYEL